MDHPRNVLQLCTDFELDDLADVTIVMSKEELDAILSIDSACEGRFSNHERPTTRMLAVTDLDVENHLNRDEIA